MKTIISSVINEAKWINKKAMEFNSPEEMAEYKKIHDVRPDTKMEVKKEKLPTSDPVLHKNKKLEYLKQRLTKTNV